jgi:hypothetical protein
MVRVYHFRLWDQDAGRYFVPPYKSPVDIVSYLGGSILSETAESVDISDLDNEQRYDPRSRRRRLLVEGGGQLHHSQ